MPSAKKKTSQADLFLLLADRLVAEAGNPSIKGYVPHQKQRIFHQSEDYVRCFFGGNRSGKTHAAVVEDIWWATGTHPYIETPPPPVRIRVVVVDIIQGLLEIMLPKFKALCRPEDLRGGSWAKAFNKYERKLYFENGSEIQFLTYEMDLEKFAGTSQHAIHFDEEPPQHIYNECAARVIDTNGRMWISMTPVDGITWVHDDIYVTVNEAPDKEMLIEAHDEIGPAYRSATEEITIVEVGMNENPHIDEKARERFLRTLTPEERLARSKGEFVSSGGKVFKTFNRDTHVVAMATNLAERFRTCTIYTSTDHGWNNPTAWLWHAVFPDGSILTFHEHYQSEMLVKDHAEYVKEYEKAMKIHVAHRTGDPAMKQVNGVTGTSILQEYLKSGIAIYVDSVPKDPAIGIEKMQQYFKMQGQVLDEEGKIVFPGRPMWYITEDCVNFIKELKNLQWDKYESKKLQFKNNKKETVQKKNDHAFDSAKYFATFMPDLAPVLPEVPQALRYNGLERYDVALVRDLEAKRTAQSGGIQWDIVENF